MRKTPDLFATLLDSTGNQTAVDYGFPSGTIGLYTNVAGTVFSQFAANNTTPVSLMGRWTNDTPFTGNTATGNSLRMSSGIGTEYNTLLLSNLRLQKFQATFALTRDSRYSQLIMGFLFNAADKGAYDYAAITHSGTAVNPVVYLVPPNGLPAVATGGSNPSTVPTCSTSDTLWCRAQNDGSTFTIKANNSPTAPSESTWSSTTACYSNASLANIGGLIGFNSKQEKGS